MYKHLFFDFDGTLWDIQANSRLTIYEIIDHFQLPIADRQAFFEAFNRFNHEVWYEYQTEQLSKERLRVARFERLFDVYDLAFTPIPDIAHYYIQHCPLQNQLIPGALELIEALHGKFKLHVLTNGFGEIQPLKLKSTGLDQYFDHLFTPKQSGYKKPQLGMFEYAADRTGAKKSESLMIGDDYLIDVRGAQRIGWDQVLFDPENKSNLQATQPLPTQTFHTLHQLKDWLLQQWSGYFS